MSFSYKFFDSSFSKLVSPTKSILASGRIEKPRNVVPTIPKSSDLVQDLDLEKYVNLEPTANSTGGVTQLIQNPTFTLNIDTDAINETEIDDIDLQVAEEMLAQILQNTDANEDLSTHLGRTHNTFFTGYKYTDLKTCSQEEQQHIEPNSSFILPNFGEQSVIPAENFTSELKNLIFPIPDVTALTEQFSFSNNSENSDKYVCLSENAQLFLDSTSDELDIWISEDPNEFHFLADLATVFSESKHSKFSSLKHLKKVASVGSSGETQNFFQDPESAEVNEGYLFEEVTQLNPDTQFDRLYKPKREKPQFVPSEQLTQRINNYYEAINSTIKMSSFHASANIAELGYKNVNPSILKNHIITSLLPNNATIENFNKFQGVDGYFYNYAGPEISSRLLALRWTNQSLNFYEPKIVRYKVDDKGKIFGKEALCPYCPINFKESLNINFHNINMSLYMHHVCKNHGVFSTGQEIPIPAFCEKNKKYFAYCFDCHKCQKLSISYNKGSKKNSTKRDLDNGLISYFRHQYKMHNRTRKKRDIGEKVALAMLFKNPNNTFVYEKKIILNSEN